jgi:hypothetical protein
MPVGLTAPEGLLLYLETTAELLKMPGVFLAFVSNVIEIVE